MQIFDSNRLEELLREHQRRQDHPIHQYIPGESSYWNQKAFHQSRCRYRLLFGGNQSGKSFTAAHEIAWWVRGKHPFRPTKPPPIEVWVISAEYSTLVSGIWRHLKKILPDWEIEKTGPNVPQQDLPTYVRLKNGSQITFKSAKGPDAREKFQAAAVDLISIDEEIEYDIWDELQARTIVTGGQFAITTTLINSYDWLVELEERAEGGDPDVSLVRLDTESNPYSDPKVLDILKKNWSLETQLVRLKGRSQRNTGLIYNNFKSHHIIEPFPIPYDWPRWRAIDPGIRTFAVFWVTVGPDNHAYGYREIYAHGAPLYEIAASIKTTEGWKLDKDLSFKFNHYVWVEPENTSSEHIILSLIDDKRNSRLITGEEGVLDQLYNRYGISSTPADKSVKVGIEDCRHWLEPMADGIPGFRVFNTCSNFINEIKRYHIRSKDVKRDRNAPIDEPVKKDDHLMDDWRYIARAYPKWADREISPHWQDRQIENPYTIKALNDRIKRKHSQEYEHEFCGTEW